MARKRKTLDNSAPAVTTQGPGRPTKYDPGFNDAVKLLAKHGATQQEIADCLHIDRITLIRWMKRYPELREAIRAGNEVFDARVERALAERAIGFYADHYVYRPTTDAERAAGAPDFVRVPTKRKYYPPNVTAGAIWLKNRKPNEWRDKPEHEHRVAWKGSAELWDEIAKDIMELQAEGMLKLPAPKDGE
jgi:Homeodomain-like domain